MNTEQLRAEFEAWKNQSGNWVYVEIDSDALEIFKAGYRAALQSQDAEDAERYRLLRSAGKETERIVEDMYECALSGEDLDAAIDHARRVEGDGE